MSQIRNKREFYRLWKQNLLGNRPILFESPEEAANYSGPYVGIREVGAAGGGWFRIVRPWEVLNVCHIWKDLGKEFVLDGAVPNDRCLLLGEITQTFRGWEGYLAIRPKVPMRAAMKDGLLKPVSGLRVRLLLEHFMDSSSYEDVRELLDLYPDATIEFGCYDVQVGILPNRNTIIWETRCY